MKQNILILLCNWTVLRYFDSVIHSLRCNNKYETILLARDKEIADLASSTFPDMIVVSGYSADLIDTIKPDIIICYQIWWWGIDSVLKRARTLNIPILHYEHGSLLYMSEYITEDDEFSSAYHADLSLCSHIACWGERSKECWMSYGVPIEKFHVTGALHLDSLYQEINFWDKNTVYDKLKIDVGKRIILFYSSLTGHLSTLDETSLNITQHLEEFVQRNPEYNLVVKPHPTEMMFYDNPLFPYSQDTKLIAHPFEDCRWNQENIVRIDVDQVMYHADICVCSTSSIIVTPMILNKPLIHVEFNSKISKNLGSFCHNSLLNTDDPQRLGDIIKSNVRPQSSGLISLFNHKNDGGATQRFLALIKQILHEKKEGKSFYKDPEEEFRAMVNRYPFLPYPYQQLILHYMQNGNEPGITYWMEIYSRYFNDPSYIFHQILHQYTNPYQSDKALDYFILFNHHFTINNLFEKQVPAKQHLIDSIRSSSVSLAMSLFNKGISLYQDGHFHAALEYFNCLKNICHISGIHIENIDEVCIRCLERLENQNTPN